MCEFYAASMEVVQIACLLGSGGPVAFHVVCAHFLSTLSLCSGVIPTGRALCSSIEVMWAKCLWQCWALSRLSAMLTPLCPPGAKATVTVINPSTQQVPSLLHAMGRNLGLWGDYIKIKSLEVSTGPGEVSELGPSSSFPVHKRG